MVMRISIFGLQSWIRSTKWFIRSRVHAEREMVSEERSWGKDPCLLYPLIFEGAQPYTPVNLNLLILREITINAHKIQTFSKYILV